VQRVLVSLSQLMQDIPEISALDINPLLVDENGLFCPASFQPYAVSFSN
jgi:hypothetical protein